VKDVVHAYLRVAEGLADAALHGQAFNFSPQSRVTVLALVEQITVLMGCGHLRPDVQNTAQGEIRSQYLSAEKAERRLGWKPTFSLEQGLRETIGWYREYLR
jgi:CDP-glucose 4,6-dehydratase